MKKVRTASLRKAAAFICAAAVCLLLSSCGTASITAPRPASTAAQTVSQTAAQTESESRTETTAAVTTAALFQEGFHFYQIECPYVPAEEAAVCTRLDFPTVLRGKRVSVIGFQDEETLLLLLYSDTEKELGTVSLKGGKVGDFQKLLDLKQSQYPRPGSDRYIIIQESTGTTDETVTLPQTYALFDTETGQLGKPYWTQSRDEHGYAVGGGSFNPHLIIGNMLYFDDYSMKDGEMTATIYGYDIGSGKITETYPECQKPMIYQGKLIGFTRNDAEDFRRLITVKDNGTAFRLECGDNLMSTESCLGSIFAVTNEGEDENDLSVCKLQNLATGQSILRANAPIGDLSISDNLVGWCRYSSNYAVAPALYDVQNQRLLSLDKTFDMDKKCFFEYVKGKTALVLVMDDARTSAEALLLKLS